MNKDEYNTILSAVGNLCLDDASGSRTLGGICGLLREKVPHYDWVGFYRLGRTGRELILGPYSGDPTEHIRIPFGRGICGQAAEKEKPIIVQDVGREKNYLSCSIAVKSEIVVPVFKNESFAGVLDIDSHIVSPFTEFDTLLLERIAEHAAFLI